MRQIPIPRIAPADDEDRKSAANREDQTRREKIIALARQITALQKTLQTARTPHERNLITRQITAADNALNAEINQLYRLSDREAALTAAPEERPPPRR